MSEVPEGNPVVGSKDGCGQNDETVIQQSSSTKLPHDEAFYEKLYTRASVVKWMALLDSIMCTLFILGGIYWALFVIIMPISGYFASKNYHKGMAIFYLLYLFLILGFRIALCLLMDDEQTIIVQGIIIALQSVIIGYVIMFIVSVSKLTEQERAALIDINEGRIQPNINPNNDPNTNPNPNPTHDPNSTYNPISNPNPNQ